MTDWVDARRMGGAAVWVDAWKMGWPIGWTGEQIVDVLEILMVYRKG